MKDYSDRLMISKGYKVSLLVLSSFNLFFALCSIGVCIPTIIGAWWTYYDCYLQGRDGQFLSYDYCNFYANLNKFSMTAQGIWTGCFVIIAASFTIDFAVKPLKKTATVSIWFTVLAVVLCTIMLVLEYFPVADYEHITHNYNDDLVWSLHCILLAIACTMWVLTLSTLIVLSTLCCCGKAKLMTKNRPVEVAMTSNVPQYGPTLSVPYVLTPAVQTQYVGQPYQVNPAPPPTAVQQQAFYPVPHPPPPEQEKHGEQF